MYSGWLDKSMPYNINSTAPLTATDASTVHAVAGVDGFIAWCCSARYCCSPALVLRNAMV